MRLLFATAVALIACASGARAAAVQASAGVSVSTGRYGEAASTTIVSVPVTAKVMWADWTAGATLSYLGIDGPADVEALDGAGVEARGAGRRQMAHGLADTSVWLTRSNEDIAGTPLYVDLTARLRLPTGEADRGLGTGAIDYGAGVELGGAWSKGGLYAGLARRWLGDAADYDRRDGWTLDAGAWLSPSSKLQLGLDYERRDTSVAGGVDPEEIDAYASWRLRPDLKLQVIATQGLSAASADFELGLSLIFRPQPRDR